MIKDISKILPKVKDVGHFAKMFGYNCPFCNKKLKEYYCPYSSSRFKKEAAHSYYGDQLILYKPNGYKCVSFYDNIIKIFDLKSFVKPVLFEGYIDSSDKENVVKNMSDIFDKYYENLIFL